MVRDALFTITVLRLWTAHHNVIINKTHTKKYIDSRHLSWNI